MTRQLKVLVCGSAGYVGSALVPYLRKHGYEVRECDLGWFTPVAHPRDYGDLTAADLDDVDSVVLLAGHSSLHMCEGQANAAYRNNVINLLSLLWATGERQVVFASTSALYGRNKWLVNEDAPVVCENDYAQTKYQAERWADASAKPVVRLRFGTVCGYSPNLRDDLMLNRMVMDARERGHLSVTPLNFWRPILDIQDCCSAIEAILSGPSARGAYHLASFNARLHDLAQEVATMLDVPVEMAETGGSPYSMRLDTSRFQRDYGFTFEGTTSSIVNDLCRNWLNIQRRSTRSKAKPYAGVLAQNTGLAVA